MSDLGDLRQAAEIEFDAGDDISGTPARLRIPVSTPDGATGQLVLGTDEMRNLLTFLSAIRTQFPVALGLS